jgi:hypothetical protein
LQGIVITLQQQTAEASEKRKKSKIHAVLFIFYVLGTVHDGLERNREYFIEGATRCVDNLSRYIIVSLFHLYHDSTHPTNILFHSYIACRLWKNSKHLGDNKLESSQRLKRNKKAAKTILTMVIVYDVDRGCPNCDTQNSCFI